MEAEVVITEINVSNTRGQQVRSIFGISYRGRGKGVVKTLKKGKNWTGRKYDWAWFCI